MKHKLNLLFAIAASALLLCSCGGSSKDYAFTSNETVAGAAADQDYGWYDDGMMYEEAEVEVPDEVVASVESPAAPSSKGDSGSDYESQRKIIKNGNLTVETLEYDKFLKELEASVTTFNGYIEYSSTSGRDGYRSANYTIRVPAEKYDAFITEVGNLGTVTSSNTSVDDVTMQYIDVEARLSAYKAERDSFMELMDRAETIDEILQIQSYLTDVNYQIESYTTQLNSLKNKVSYSTVTLYVSEVERVTPAEPKTVWERISTNLSENLYSIGEGFKNFFVWFVSSLPYFAVYAAIIAVIVAVIVLIIKASNRRQRRKVEEYRKNMDQQNEENKK